MKILSVLGIGVLRIVQSTVNKKSSALTNTFTKSLSFVAFFEFSAAVFALFYLLTLGFSGFNIATVLCAVITGAGYLSEILTAFAALRKAPLVLCTFCSLGGGIIISSIMEVLFFGEAFSFIKGLGVVLFFVSAFLLSPKEKKEDLKSGKNAFWLLTANFLINGMLSTMGKFYAVCIEENNAALYTFLSYLSAAILCFLLLRFIGRKNAVNIKNSFPKRVYLYGTVLGATCSSIVFFSVVLAAVMPVVILNTIPNAMCIIGSLFLGCLLFGEKLSATRCVGALISLASIILMLASI